MHHHTTPRGFTLIELMVAVGIFSIIMLLATSGYLALIAADKNVQTTSTATNNLSAAVDAMVHDIRTGSCSGGTCPTSGTSSSFSFTNNAGCAVTYTLGSDKALHRIISSAGAACKADNEALTNPSSVEVTSLNFDTFTLAVQSAGGGQSHTGEQLWVTIGVTGIIPGSSGTATKLHVETGATMRSISIL